MHLLFAFFVVKVKFPKKIKYVTFFAPFWMW